MTSTAPPNPTNEFGLTIGFEINDWKGAGSPDSRILQGQYCRCEPLSLYKHSEQLFDAWQRDTENRIWVYLPYGPFETLEDCQQWMNQDCFTGDPFFYAIVDNQTGLASGVASYLRIKPDAGSIEVGHINYSPALQKTCAATEAMYLMMKNTFDMGYRRYEWKCNALNQKSCDAAKRLGFTFEGIFRQATVVKGRNRDTAWFSILDREWPAVSMAYETWLSADNFDHNNVQKQSLSALIRMTLNHGIA